ncbi:hypothetical protein KIH87_03030 [Paraneptunicella aestuarii]|uniref:hypothetical protein n=1 Tax=Paraneptunicella aestuarii TaxID=2831148 RepID=UPI001E4702AB|nr:hypothetical protein [Paraneptunicella aestuarii]UAA39355.1 hypothetical protein KIH87_03030 [Paraneptunicella aestuarii]
MRNVILIMLFSLFSAILHAKEAETQQNLFKCVDNESLAIDDACIEGKFDANLKFQEQKFTIAGMSDEFGENAMATLRFYPDKMLIEVVAHADEQESGLVSRIQY